MSRPRHLLVNLQSSFSLARSTSDDLDTVGVPSTLHADAGLTRLGMSLLLRDDVSRHG